MWPRSSHGAEVQGLGNLLFLGDMSSEVGAGSGGATGGVLRSLSSVLDTCGLPLPSPQSLVSDDGDLEVDFPSCSISPRSS